MSVNLGELGNTNDMATVFGSLYHKFAKSLPDSIKALPLSGSPRKYYRIKSGEISVIGSYNSDIQEHKAFLDLSYHFHDTGLPVPRILYSEPDTGICLIEDLGDETLLERINKERTLPDFNDLLIFYYQKVLTDLIRFQLDGDKGLNYNNLPVPEFDRQAMYWDLNYFKYYFLKPSAVVFNEKLLELDFEKLLLILQQEKLKGFMYRDFQARNIMLHNEKYYYIDYQGGRKGPLQYDVVSLLFQAKAAIPDYLKEQLLDHYIQELEKRITFNRQEFRVRFNYFVLLRLLQVMGAYGFRGWFERKAHFLESIPLLQPNIQWLLDNQNVIDDMPELKRVLSEILFKMENNLLVQTPKLTIEINSFSYRRGIPYDPSGHGGGFVFDCRLLPNPGLLEPYKKLTGLDSEVILFLKKEDDVKDFIENAATIVKQSARNYLKSGYTNLQVNFGCTGGQHRSVYCAEKLAEILKQQTDISIILKHREINILK